MKPETLPLQAWREALVDIAREAGEVIMAIYATDFADTADNRARVIGLAHGAHTLFCESTFCEADADQAARTAHLTTRACAEIAEAAGVARLVPFHFSRRYEHDPAAVYGGIAALSNRVVMPEDMDIDPVDAG